MHSDLGLVFEGFKYSKCTRNVRASYNADRAVLYFRCGIFLGERKMIVTPFFQNRDVIIRQRAIFVSPPREGGATEATQPYLLAGAEHFENVRRRVGV